MSGGGRYRRRLLVACLAACLAVCATPPLLAQSSRLAQPAPAPRPTPEFRVVVHADHPLDAIERGLLAKIFIKKISRWDDGSLIQPIDQVATSPVREAFTDAVHKKSVSAVKSYWQRMIFSGRDVPPPEYEGDAAVLDAVRRRPGAVGYVGSETPLGDEVKELEVVEE